MKENKVEVISNLSDHYIHDLVELYKNEFWCSHREITDVKIMLKNTDIVIDMENEKRDWLDL